MRNTTTDKDFLAWISDIWKGFNYTRNYTNIIWKGGRVKN